jgi:putative transposase
MTYDPSKHHRRSIRLRQYDYAWPGAYFVTLCVREKECVLGDIVDGEMQLSEIGRIVRDVWDSLPARYPNIELDSFVIMPNHMHGIIVIVGGVGAIHESPLRDSPQQRRNMLLPKIMGYFKMNTAKRINALRGTPGVPFWQRNYWEHVIRDDSDSNRIRQYIENNLWCWHEDQLNPSVLPRPTKR